MFSVPSAQASTIVTGDNDRTSPLVIEPSGTGTVSNASKMVMFIQKMPVTKTVNRITLGDIGLDPGCTYTGPVLKLFIRQHPTGQIGTETNSLYWEGNALEEIAADTDLEPRTWRTEPITFVKGRGYSFWVQGTINGCNSYKLRSWPHNHPQVNTGQERCDRVLGSSFRMWHEAGQSDAVPCPYDLVPGNFDSGMPEGWLSVTQSWGSSYVETKEFYEQGAEPPQPTCPYPLGEYGGIAQRWRSALWSSNWGEYVCLWDQRYPDWVSPSSPFYPNDPDDGWYYGPGWMNPAADWPRDMYLKLDLDDDELAAWYKPNLYFDSSEKWRPLNLQYLFLERDEGEVPLHYRCRYVTDPPPPQVPCTELHSLDEVVDYDGIDAFLKLNENADAPDEYVSPDPACRTDDLYDCNSGPKSSLYYYVGSPGGDAYRYIGYWAFYRYNHYWDVTADYDHEGDWEGLAVAPSQERPGTFDFVSFSAHTHWWSYLRDTLECDDGDWYYTCGSDSDRYGSHLRSYVANGTHANYPDSCSEGSFGDCRQPESSVPERGHDGTKSWGNNAPRTTGADSTGLVPFPELWAGSWVDWPGRWGATGQPLFHASPASPGNQAPFLDPWDQCVGDSAACPPGTAGIRPRRGPAPRACRSWFGPAVAALSCDRRRLRGAVARRELGSRGRATGSVRGPAQGAARTRRDAPRVGRAPGLVQVVGEALKPGDRLVLRGAASARDVLLVRYRSRGHLYEAVFRRVVLVPGRHAILKIAPGGARLELAATRRVLRPASVRRAVVAAPTAKRP